MNKYSSHNNNASSYLMPSYNSKTLHVIRSIVDELYNQETSSNEKKVRFALEQEFDTTESQSKSEISIRNCLETEKSSIKYQPILSESPTVVCCLIKGRSKVDCSVSTNDILSPPCECATQTMDITFSPINDNRSTIDLHRARSNITLSPTWISSTPTISHHLSSPSITSHRTLNHSLYSCENNDIVQTLNTAHQLIMPSIAKVYDICQEQTYNTLMIHNNPYLNASTSEEMTKLDDNVSLSTANKKLLNENITEIDFKFCTCSKEKLFDNHFSMITSPPNQGKLLEELHLSKRSLQSMHDDGLFYIHDLVFIFLQNISQFYQRLVKQYYLPQKQANLFMKVMNKWWKNHQTDFININES